MKFGLMKFSYTINIGNEIQSIAARQFLPKIDYYIDHEKLNIFESDEKVKMIMNGWYLDCLSSWPPSNDIDPLLISMHFNKSINETKKVISTPESKDFFSTYGPVGCRDLSTLNLLNELDIDAYYSGDLTLTLTGSKSENNEKYIVVNLNSPKELINYLKTKTELPIYEMHHDFMESLNPKKLNNRPISYTLTSFYDFKEKFFIAENFLNIYENAQCVITDRVHCALPCLALKTPVLFFNSAEFGPERIFGLNELVLQSHFEEYKNNYSIFDVENPPQNPKYYLKIRKDLINKTKKFTGYYSKNYDSNFSKTYIINKQAELLAKNAAETRNYMEGVINLSNRYESEISKIKK